MIRPTTSPALRGRRILVVEDEYIYAYDLCQELERHGAEILGPVPSVADALALLAQGNRPDLAVLDVNLGGEMVYGLADVLDAQSIPFTFATAYMRQEIPGTYAHVPHCEKPLKVHRLAELLTSQGRLAPRRGNA